MLPSLIKSLLLDMDGVLWIENQPIGNLPAIFATIKNCGLKLCLATNNSTRTPEQSLDRLRSFGVMGLTNNQIVTSSQALAHEFQKLFPRGGEIYVIGEYGLRQALADTGFAVIDEKNINSSSRILAVAVGMDRSIDYQKLRRATLLIRSGTPFYATNPDRTFPTPEGLIPGAGMIIAALEAASDRKPIIIGKPALFMINLAMDNLGTKPEETLVVGDRLETDITGGQAAGCPVALVLTGVTKYEMGKRWRPKINFIVEKLADLLH